MRRRYYWIYCGWFLLVMSLPVLAHGQGAKLTFFVGMVEGRGANQPEWRSLTLNQTLAQGDTVRTGQESRAELTFADGSILRINEQSRIVVRQLAGNDQTQKRNILLLLGEIWTNAVKLLSAESTLNVESPTTVAAIRGTIYRMNVDPRLTTEVRVYDGEVAVSPVASDTVTAERTPAAATPWSWRRDDQRRSGEVQGPRRVSGPRQVSLGEWIEIVRAMQRIVVEPDGNREVSAFSATEEADDEWILFNQKRDRLLKR